MQNIHYFHSSFTSFSIYPRDLPEHYVRAVLRAKLLEDDKPSSNSFELLYDHFRDDRLDNPKQIHNFFDLGMICMQSFDLFECFSRVDDKYQCLTSTWCSSRDKNYSKVKPPSNSFELLFTISLEMRLEITPR
eukprot:scaffold5155_cov132-Skeletonema_marinoi.AAC.9